MGRLRIPDCKVLHKYTGIEYIERAGLQFDPFKASSISALRRLCLLKKNATTRRASNTTPPTTPPTIAPEFPPFEVDATDFAV